MTEALALADAIAAIGSAGFVPRALDYLRASVDFPGCLLLMLDGDRPPVHIYDNVRYERRADVVDRYLDGAYLLDPFYVVYLASKPCTVLRLRDVAPDRFQQSPYFAQYYHSLRLADEAAILIDLPSGKHLFYSIGGMPDARRFTARDMQNLRRMLPVFAAINRRHFAAAQYDDTAPAAAAVTRASIAAAMARFGDAELTEREREIAILILKGHSTNSIGEMTGISPGTVKIHRKNLYRKLGISSQSALFARFLDSLAGQRAG